MGLWIQSTTFHIIIIIIIVTIVDLIIIAAVAVVIIHCVQFNIYTIYIY